MNTGHESLCGSRPAPAPALTTHAARRYNVTYDLEPRSP